MLEVAIEEARGLNPHVVVQACTAAMSAEGLPGAHAACPTGRRRHCLYPDPDDGGARRRGRAAVLQYIAERTDIALGMFNSPSSGYVLTPAEVRGSMTRSPRSAPPRRAPSARRAAVCCTSWRPAWRSGSAKDRLPRRWLRDGSSARPSWAPPATSSRPRSGRCSPNTGTWSATTSSLEAMDYGRESGLDQFELDIGSWFTVLSRAGPITSPTGVARSNTPRRCSACRSVPIRIRGRRKPSCRRRPRLRSKTPIVASDSSMPRRRRG